MPIIYLVTKNMFEIEDVCDYMVNPTNTKKVMGAGLAAEFRRRCGDLLMDPYRQACHDKSFRIGTVQVVEEVGQNWGVINFPTKDHWLNTSEKGDIARGLEALRDLLKTDKYRYASICLPMLGCGLGKQDYPTVLPMMEETLKDVEATVFISMSPERTDMRPKYLLIAGPPDYGFRKEDQDVIDETIDKVMNAWGMSLSDYTGIISGGYPGVDTYIAGRQFNSHSEDTFVYKRTGIMPLVIKPNTLRNGVGSNLLHNNLLCTIADDAILFKPHASKANNNRLSLMQMWLRENKQKRLQEGRDPQRVAISGDVDTNPVIDKIKIPVEGGDS